MKHHFLSILTLSLLVLASRADQDLNRGPVPPAGPSSNVQDCVVLPGTTSAIQMRLYTNGLPKARHLVNTFEILADGETLLPAAGGDAASGPSSESGPWLHNILIDGLGPDLGSTNHLRILEQCSGSEWRYISLDVSSAYHGRVDHLQRGLLFVEPNLFVVCDRVVATKPVAYQMVLHPPATTLLDTNWGDLRVNGLKWGCRIRTPGRKGSLRSWKRIESPADSVISNTVTMVCGPTNKVTTLDVITVLAVYTEGEKQDFAFKLLESKTAVGARIHRAGLPTLVAFKTAAAAAGASLTGFEFSGPVGVAVFTPKQRTR
jgi:hypothetical protein